MDKFKPGDKIKPVLECSGLTLGKTYTVVEHELHKIIHGFPAWPESVVLIGDDNGIDGWLANRFELVENADIDFLAITRSLCGG